MEKGKAVVCGDYSYAIYNGVLCRWLTSDTVDCGREKVPDNEIKLLPPEIQSLCDQQSTMPQAQNRPS